MRLGLSFVGLSTAFAVSAVHLGGWRLVLLWPATSFAVLAAGYLLVGARVFGKRQDGRLHPLSVLSMAPFLAGTWLVIWITNAVSREPPYHTLLPGVLIGRRLAPREYPEEVDAVLDLTAELHAPPSIVRRKAYRCLPILDTRVPSKDELVAEVRKLQAHDGTTLVHCAQGHGRTGLVACALLIAEGVATTADEALERARERRPRARLSGVQKRLLVEVIPDLTSDLRAGSPAV